MRSVLYFLIIIGLQNNVVAQDSLPVQKNYRILFFLLEDCKITQAYIPTINELYSSYANDSIHFHGYFPSPSSNNESVNIFCKKYKLSFDTEMDPNQIKAQDYEIDVLPQVVVINPLNQVIYQGRIDNLFERIGKRRPRASSHELQDCLEKIKNAQPVIPQKTKAVGCALTRFD